MNVKRYLWVPPVSRVADARMWQIGESWEEGFPADAQPLHLRVVDVEGVGPENADHPKDFRLAVVQTADLAKKVDNVHLKRELF